MSSYQSPVPYGKRITFLFLSIAFLGIVLSIAGGTNTVVGSVGATLFLGVMSSALIIDRSGVITLRCLIDWSCIHGKKRFWLIIAWICLFPLFFCAYLVRVAMHQFGPPALPVAAPAPRKVKVGLAIGSFVVCFGLISAFSSANGAIVNPAAPVVTVIQTNTSFLVRNASTQMSAVTAIPAPTNTPKPTPTQLPPPPAPTPTPQANPCPNAVNGNPWCYDFQPGLLISRPPAAFCNYFPCIGSFWNERGYVMECQDGDYSQSGGIQGSCSQHGGNLRPLYSH